jgi:hypothetical protein
VNVGDIFQTTRHRIYGSCGRGNHFVFKTVLTGTCEEIGQGKTKDESEAAALALVKAQVQNAHKVRYFTSPSGKTMFVVRFQWGWGYDIVRDGKSRGSCSTGDTFEETCEKAQRHAADYEEMD